MPTGHECRYLVSWCGTRATPPAAIRPGARSTDQDTPLRVAQTPSREQSEGDAHHRGRLGIRDVQTGGIPLDGAIPILLLRCDQRVQSSRNSKVGS
jgi:hypothetical protein